MPGLLALLVAVACCLRPTTAAEVDLLRDMSLHNSTRQGVAAALDQQPPSYIFTGDYRDLQIPPLAFNRAVELLRRSPEFTMMAFLKQEVANSGSIISFSHGYNRYLELQSSGRKDEIRLHYRVAGSEDPKDTKMESFPYRLADNKWHRLALSVSGTEVQVLLDCLPIYKRIISLPDRNFSHPQLALWLGQRNGKHAFYKGELADVRIVTGPHGYLSQCPAVPATCPTCGQFSIMEQRIEKLENQLATLASRLHDVEGRMTVREGCDCQKSCVINTTIHADGATWQKDCNLCSCVKGQITCRPVECAPPECKNPVLHPGDCCPTCLKQCVLKGVLYEHGVQVSLKQCVECECRNGNMGCNRVDPEKKCPPLLCPAEEQFSVPGECCNFCPGVDYCSLGHNCHENATCMNLSTDYTCKCNQGFQGDGKTCTDVDECSSDGSLWGDHCHLHTKCTNTVGSYICQCEEGYTRSDKFNCVEMDECASGEHRCSSNAHCINTAGSYSCHCIQGYKGDGYDCQPICTGGCLNSGTCIAPESCSCRAGFTGAHCERDLDECATNTHHCSDTANCVNMPGWYYCKCKAGYRSVLLGGDSQATSCQDINECVEGLQTCHPSAQCVNTEGSFQCKCSTPECRLSCMHDGIEMADGREWVEADGCRTCSCSRGVSSCAPVACHCGVGGARGARGAAPPGCCPQCVAAYDCHHQELHHVVFHSGEKWVYQCQTCECLLGDIDCWELECPGGAGVPCCPPSPPEPPPSPEEPPCSPNSSTPCPRALHHAAPDCQMAYCASLVSNIACCVHRSVLVALAVVWCLLNLDLGLEPGPVRGPGPGGSKLPGVRLCWRRGLGTGPDSRGPGAKERSHRKHRGVREAPP